MDEMLTKVNTQDLSLILTQFAAAVTFFFPFVLS